MKIHRLLACVPAVLASSFPANAQTLCAYITLVQSHELVSHCGETIDAASEQRYTKSVSSLATLIVNNTPELKGKIEPEIWDFNYKKNVHDRYNAMDQSICAKADYSGFKGILISMTSESGTAKVDAIIKSPKYLGDNTCF